MSQGEQTSNVFDASPMLGGDAAAGAGNDIFASLNDNLFSCAYGNVDSSTKMPMRSSNLEDAGLKFGDQALEGAKALVPTFGDSQPVAQVKPDAQPLKGDTLDMACVTTLFKNDAGQKAMCALQADRSFENMVKKAA